MNVNWKKLIEMVAPLGGAMAAGEGNRGSFMSGWQHGASIAQQERAQQQAQQQQQQAKAGQFKLDMVSKLMALDDPFVFQQMKDAAAHGGQSLFGMDPQEWQGVTFPESKTAAKSLKELNDLLDGLAKQGHNIDDLAESGSSIETASGQRIPVASAIELTRRAPISASGQRVPVPKKEKPGGAGTEIERAAALRKRARDAMLAGNGPEADLANAEYYNLRETKREMGDDGRAQGDPEIEAIKGNLLRLRESLDTQRLSDMQRNANAPPKPTPELPPITQRRVQQLEDQFKNEPAVKRANTIAEGYGFVKSLSDTSNNPADDQALIYAFAKAMDPESVVREGEYATVQKYSQSWLQGFKFNAQRVLTNSEFLSPESRKQIKATIRAKFNASKSSYDNIRKQYISQLDRVSGQKDGASRLVDYGAAYPDTPATPAAGGSKFEILSVK